MTQSLYTAPEDYGFVNTTSTFVNTTAQGGSGSQMCIEIPIVDNNLVEFDKVFQVTADSPDPNVNTTFITATIVIMDEDGEKESVYNYDIIILCQNADVTLE